MLIGRAVAPVVQAHHVKGFTRRTLAIRPGAMVDLTHLMQKEAYSMAQSTYEIDAVVLRHESMPVFPA